jgi:hypothetical protein
VKFVGGPKNFKENITIRTVFQKRIETPARAKLQRMRISKNSEHLLAN